MARGGTEMAQIGNIGKTAIILAHAIVGWGYCGGLIAVGRQYLSIDTTLIVHAVGAPVGFTLLSWLYHRKFGFTSPLNTAWIFLGVVIALDVFLVALVFEKSFAMFTSLMGTWIPFVLIFGATYITGVSVSKNVCNV